MCVGNPDGGDDALGVRLGEELTREQLDDVIVAGAEPERFVGCGATDGYDHLVFVDAVDFGAAPGSIVFLNSEEMAARFPQVSTHRLSLGLLGRWIESQGNARAWLLGVQPESLVPDRALSRSAQVTLAVLKETLIRRLKPGTATC
jgi:hydrogenase maturation protease